MATELFSNPPTPGGSIPWVIANLSQAISTAPAAGTQESWSVTAPAPSSLRSSSAAQFRVVIEAEIMIVTASTSGASPWTFTRGAEGTTPVPHASGLPIYHVLTAGALNNVSGSGGTTGALLAANNLSDVASVATARTNLGLGTAATQATTAFDTAGAAAAAVVGLAPLASPALTGTPTSPTPTQGDSSTKIATTAFVSQNSGISVTTINPVLATQSLALPSFAGGAFAITLTQNTTLSITGASSSVEANVDIWLTQDVVGSRTVTWPGSITWLAGSAPTLPTGPGLSMLVSLVSKDGGTTWYGYYNSGQGAFPPWPGTWFSSPMLGNVGNKTHTANTLYGAAFIVPGQATLTGFIYYSAGTTSGNMLISLFNSAGTLVASSASTAQGAANAPHQIPFSTPYAAVAGTYVAGFQFDNATAQTYDNVFGIPVIVAAQGSFAAPSLITFPTTISNATIPAFSTY